MSSRNQPFLQFWIVVGIQSMERNHFFTCIMNLVLSCAGLTIPAFQRNSWLPTCKSNTMFLFQFQTKFCRGLMKQTQRLLKYFTTDRLMQSFQISKYYTVTLNAHVAQRYTLKKELLSPILKVLTLESLLEILFKWIARHYSSIQVI